MQVNDMLDAVERLADGGFEMIITVRNLDSDAGVWAQFHDADGNEWLLWQSAVPLVVAPAPMRTHVHDRACRVTQRDRVSECRHAQV